MNLLNPDCVKGGGLGAGWSGDEGQDDGGPRASHRGALAPSLPGPPSAPYWLHHDSRWHWAGRARCLQTHRTDGQTRRPTVPPHTHSQPRPAWPPSHTMVLGASCRPGPICPGRGRQGGEGRARDVGDGHQEQMRKTRVANPFSCPLLALGGLPGAGWQCWPQGWPLGPWRRPLR